VGSGVVSATPKISLGMAKSQPHLVVGWLPTPKQAKYGPPQNFYFFEKILFFNILNKKN
jgi:hypothetical protein